MAAHLACFTDTPEGLEAKNQSMKNLALANFYISGLAKFAD